jgi:hypothetical protein
MVNAADPSMEPDGDDYVNQDRKAHHQIIPFSLAIHSGTCIDPGFGPVFGAALGSGSHLH